MKSKQQEIAEIIYRNITAHGMLNNYTIEGQEKAAQEIIKLFIIQDARNSLREVEVNSHNFFIRGYFHRFFDKNNETYALIEDEHGMINEYSLNYHSLKFIDI